MVVAVDRADEARLAEVHRRSLANGVPGTAMVWPDGLRDLARVLLDRRRVRVQRITR